MITNEEAIKNLKDILAEATETDNAVCYVTSVDADTLKAAIRALEQEPSEDCISREKLDKALYERFHEEDSPNNITDVHLGEVRSFIRSFPSKPKTGHWILADVQNKEDVENDNYRFICSECQCSDIHAKGTVVPYCWKCGAKMVEPQESEDKE